MHAGPCRHFFCADCWRGYFSEAISGGPACLDLRCPLPDCKVTVSSTPGCHTAGPASGACGVRCELRSVWPRAGCSPARLPSVAACACRNLCPSRRCRHHAPAHAAPCQVPSQLVRSLVSPEDTAKYDNYVLRSFVEDNRAMSWCTGANCDAAVQVSARRERAAARIQTQRGGRLAAVAFLAGGRRQAVVAPAGQQRGSGELTRPPLRPQCLVERGADEPLDVLCACSATFCFNCKEEAHRPVSCETVRRWVTKNSAESENLNWILANTKPCPKCHRPIEKNQVGATPANAQRRCPLSRVRWRCPRQLGCGAAACLAFRSSPTALPALEDRLTPLSQRPPCRAACT